MTEYTPAKDELLMALASAIIGGAVDSVALHRLKQAAQGAMPPLAEPKPSAGVSEEVVDAALHAYKEWFALDPLEDRPSAKAMLREIIEAAAPYIRAKDSDLAAVIRDNDAKMAEIERWKKSAERLSEQTNECLRLYIRSLETRLRTPGADDATSLKEQPT